MESPAAGEETEVESPAGQETAGSPAEEGSPEAAATPRPGRRAAPAAAAARAARARLPSVPSLNTNAGRKTQRERRAQLTRVDGADSETTAAAAAARTSVSEHPASRTRRSEHGERGERRTTTRARDRQNGKGVRRAPTTPHARPLRRRRRGTTTERESSKLREPGEEGEREGERERVSPSHSFSRILPSFRCPPSCYSGFFMAFCIHNVV